MSNFQNSKPSPVADQTQLHPSLSKVNLSGLDEIDLSILSRLAESGKSPVGLQTLANHLREVQADDKAKSDAKTTMQFTGDKCIFFYNLEDYGALRTFQTCIRSWFLAALLNESFEWPENRKRLSFVLVDYWEWDGLYDDLIMNAVRLKSKSPDHAAKIEVSHNTIDEFQPGTYTSIIDMKTNLCEWFTSFMESFEEGADNLTEGDHTYAFACMNDLLMYFIRIEQEKILAAA